MDDWSEFLAFRKFITPVFIQVIFWLMVIGAVISALITMFRGGVAGFFLGLIWLVVGPVIARIYCELLILLFRIYDELVAMRTGVPPGAAPPGFPVTPVAPVPPSVPPGAPGM